MIHKNINGKPFSIFGLGTWVLGDAYKHGWGKCDFKNAYELIYTAIEAGINWLDTAAIYGYGKSEDRISKIVGNREDIYISTKGGLKITNNEIIEKDASVKFISKEIEGSLRRLKRDCIDFYFLHWPDNKVPIEVTWRAMEKFRKQGKIKYLGLSNHSYSDIKRALKVGNVDAIQVKHNIMFQKDPKYIELATKNNIHIFNYSPLCSGLLCNSFDENKLDANDWRKTKSDKYTYYRSNNPTRKKIIGDAKEKGLKLEEYALKWVLENSPNQFIIMGGRNPPNFRNLIEKTIKDIELYN